MDPPIAESRSITKVISTKRQYPQYNYKKMKSFIEKIPKAELHLHIEGTLEPELIFKIAKRNKIELKYNSVEKFKKAYNFKDLNSFLYIYYTGMNVLLYEQDFYDLTWAYLEKAHEQNILHAEIFFDPQAHTERGISFNTIINGIHHALEDGKSKLGLSSKIIMCFLRHLSEESAMKTLEESIIHRDKIIAVGLDSSELNNPPSKFKNVFSKAKSYGYKTVAHAGEEGPPEYIWEAINILNVDRIDHGVRCLEDEQLVRILAENQIPLTICPLSNVKLKVFKDLKELRLHEMLSKGLKVTINSDDPPYFGGYIHENLMAVQETFNLNQEDIIRLAKNSFESSFLTKEEKNHYLATVV